MSRKTIYLDNAATSWPKPPAVAESITHFLAEGAGNPGRAGHRMSVAAMRVVERLRERLASLINAGAPERIVFTLNCTDGLNLAIHGIAAAQRVSRRQSPGAPLPRVVTSVLEHNAVSRPLETLAERGEIELVRVECDANGFISPDAVLGACSESTVLVALAHAGNVLGSIQPIAQVGRKLRATVPGALFLVDAAQSAGSIPIEVESMAIDLLAISGHKALLGPMGAGALYIGARAYDTSRGVERILPVRHGGTGGDSASALQPRELPHAFEAGTPPSAALAGWLAAMEHVDLGRIEHERLMAQQIIDHYSSGGRVRVPGPPMVQRTPIVSLAIEGVNPVEAAAVLDEAFSIAVRAGLDCAPGAHRALGTFPAGMLRISPGPFTTAEDIESFISAFDRVLASMR